MKAIIVEQEDFDRAFQETLDQLQLTRFIRKPGETTAEDVQFENSPIGAMHRAFVYEVVGLQRRLEKIR